MVGVGATKEEKNVKINTEKTMEMNIKSRLQKFNTWVIKTTNTNTIFFNIK